MVQKIREAERNMTTQNIQIEKGSNSIRISTKAEKWI